MRVLGIETSCDETGVALYDHQDGLLADALYSQVALHAEFGGVVPELASRDHIRRLLPLIRAVLDEAEDILNAVGAEVRAEVEAERLAAENAGFFKRIFKRRR